MCNGRQSDPGSAFKKDPLAGAVQEGQVVRIDGHRRRIVVGDRGGAAVSTSTAAPRRLVNRSREPETSICCAAVGYRLDAK